MVLRTPRPVTLPAAALAVGLCAAACSGSSSGSGSGGYGAPAAPAPKPSATAAAAAAGTTIDIRSFSFSPHTLSVKAGTKVTVTNDDTTSHTWTATGGAFDSGELAHGSSYSFVFSKAGTFSYACSIHPSMTGSVVVTP